MKRKEFEQNALLIQNPALHLFHSQPCKKKHFTCVVQQDVLWLQVSVDDPVLMEMFQPTDDLSCIETRSLLIKARILFIHIVHMIPVRRGRWYDSV